MKIKISKCSNYDATKGKDQNNKIVAQGWELQEIDWDENKLRELVTLNGISFNEYDYSPYDCFRHTSKISERKYRIKHLDKKIPMVYSMVFRKK